MNGRLVRLHRAKPIGLSRTTHTDTTGSDPDTVSDMRAPEALADLLGEACTRTIRNSTRHELESGLSS
jgi:hypothetical protein